MADTTRRRLLATATTAAVPLTALAGCVSGGDAPGTIVLEIETEDAWEGILKEHDSTRKIGGRGSKRYEWVDEYPGPIHASITKGPRADTPLTATILADGDQVSEASTTTANDRIQVNYTP